MSDKNYRYDPKRPDEILDYEIDFAGVMGTDTLLASRVDVVGATKVSSTNTGTVVKFRISGGTKGTDALITVEVDGTSGQLYEEVEWLRIRA